jgi:hypothetical protein
VELDGHYQNFSRTLAMKQYGTPLFINKQVHHSRDDVHEFSVKDGFRRELSKTFRQECDL